MAESYPAQPGAEAEAPAREEVRVYTRFSRTQRIEHAVLLVSFSLLGITGLAQKYAITPAGEAVISLLGGIETARIIHRTSAVALMAVSIFHIVAVIYRVFVQRAPLSMLPTFEDFRHLFHDILFYLGRRARKAYYGRYTYAEKVEYLAVVWGTVIMAITGFMMWNPIATARFLPGEAIPAAKAAHGGEALLAVLAIIIWHFYHVHIRHFNRSMFTGKLTEEEMEHEHPAELDAIRSGTAHRPPPPEVVRQRERIFYPLAGVIVLVLGYGLVRFVTFEETAITTLPPGETAPVFVPITPTPLPTLTPLPEGALNFDSWEGGVSVLFENRCGSCHVQGSFGGLSLATYQDALEGGLSGPGVVPGDPDNSVVVQIQAAGGHPGQLSPDELAQVVEWIQAGATEQ